MQITGSSSRHFIDHRSLERMRPTDSTDNRFPGPAPQHPYLPPRQVQSILPTNLTTAPIVQVPVTSVRASIGTRLPPLITQHLFALKAAMDLSPVKSQQEIANSLTNSDLCGIDPTVKKINYCAHLVNTVFELYLENPWSLREEIKIAYRFQDCGNPEVNIDLINALGRTMHDHPNATKDELVKYAEDALNKVPPPLRRAYCDHLVDKVIELNGATLSDDLQYIKTIAYVFLDKPTSRSSLAPNQPPPLRFHEMAPRTSNFSNTTSDDMRRIAEAGNRTHSASRRK